MKKYNLKNNSGFTLIELLVVIAIISLISTVIFSALQESRAKAEVQGVDAAIYQLRTAVSLYVEDGNTYPLSITRRGSDIIDLVKELYDAGYYNSEDFDVISNSGLIGSLGVYAYTSTRLKHSGERYGRPYSCGHGFYDNTYGVIAVFGGNDLFRQNTTLPDTYFNGRVSRRDTYCLEI